MIANYNTGILVVDGAVSVNGTVEPEYRFVQLQGLEYALLADGECGVAVMVHAVGITSPHATHHFHFTLLHRS